MAQANFAVRPDSFSSLYVHVTVWFGANASAPGGPFRRFIDATGVGFQTCARLMASRRAFAAQNLSESPPAKAQLIRPPGLTSANRPRQATGTQTARKRLMG